VAAQSPGLPNRKALLGHNTVPLLFPSQLARDEAMPLRNREPNFHCISGLGRNINRKQSLVLSQSQVALRVCLRSSRGAIDARSARVLAAGPSQPKFVAISKCSSNSMTMP